MDRRVVAVTGASGFIGSALCGRLEELGRPVRRIARRSSGQSPVVNIGDIGPETDWSDALKGVDCVVHTAARAHVLVAGQDDDNERFARTNEHGTRRLAEQSAASGVRRLVFLSSVGVLGNRTDVDSAFDHKSAPAPIDTYAKSKWAAEKALWQVSRDTGLEVVIVRPPLVYGKGAPGNIGRLLRLVESGLPMPFGSIRNKRSFVSLQNLVGLLIECIDSGNAAGETLLVSDGEDLSTSELFKMLASMEGRKGRVFSVPTELLQLAATVLGKSHEVSKLTDSLRIDIRYTIQKLAWRPTTANPCANDFELDARK